MITRRKALTGLAAGTAVVTSGLHLSASEAKARTIATKALPIPALNTGRLEQGVRVYDLTLRKGKSNFYSDVTTPTLGINGDYLGPTLKLTDGEQIRLNVTNTIGEATTIHWHGLHLPAKADGGPHQVIEPGKTWSPSFTVKQQASTFWYHPHLMHKTGLHAYMGMAGAIIVEDKESKSLDLPNTYGVDDIPVVLQDKRFNKNGTLQYSRSVHDRMNGMKGDVLLVNGAITPHFTATTQKVRLRFVNASNARFYTLGFNDNRSFDIIAGDGSLLPAPVKATRFVVSPGERCEIVVDVSDLKGTESLTLKSFGYTMGSRQGSGMMRMMQMMGDNQRKFDVMHIVAAPSLKASLAVPARLARIERLNPKDATVTRHFSLEMIMGPSVMMGRVKTPLTINGKAMDKNRIDERVKLGATEIWEIKNVSAMAHPFHIHDIQFQILDRNGTPPPAQEMGLKDTVLVVPGETVRVIAKFEDYADPDTPYMYHCHILDHEDWGMMGQFTVEA